MRGRARGERVRLRLGLFYKWAWVGLSEVSSQISGNGPKWVRFGSEFGSGCYSIHKTL